MQAALILGTVRDFVDDYCLPRGGGQGLPADVRARLVTKSPLPQRVWMSIIALGHALTSAMISGCDIRRTGSRWGGSIMLEHRISLKGWCPLDVRTTFLSDSMCIYEQYYLSKMENVDRTISHDNCTEYECRGRNVDEATYHQDGDIPVFKWNLESKELELRAVKVNARGVGKPPFMAISHVWSDGLGNSKDNAIYECQLEALQKSVQLAATNHKMLDGKPSHFWIDTLCVPVQKQFKDLRKKCIQDMRRIYECSCSVYVLSSLRNIATTAKGPERQIAEVFNNWDRRLWTYQECIMARKRLIQYADKIVDHVSIEADFFRDMLWSSDEPDDAAEPLPPYAASIASRSTSRKSDEMLCVATLMRLDLKPFLEAESEVRNERGLSGTEEVSDVDIADKRMEIFWQTIGVCQWGVLFNSHRRLSIDGLRWAPATFLGSPLGGFCKRVDQGFCRLDKKGRGLSFSAQGILIEIPSTWEPRSCAITINLKDPKIGRVCLEVTPRDLSFPLQTFKWAPSTQYVIILEKLLSTRVPKRTGDPMANLPQTQLQVEDWLETVFQPGRVNKMALDAVVATVTNPTLKHRCQVRHECLAVAKIVESPVLDKFEEDKFTIWDEPSRMLLQDALEAKKFRDEVGDGAEGVEHNNDDLDDGYETVSSDDDWSDGASLEDGGEAEERSPDAVDDSYDTDNNNAISSEDLISSEDSDSDNPPKESYYYDDLDSESESDADEINEAWLLEVDDDALDSGSEAADEHCCGLFDGKQSHSIPSTRVKGTLTRENTKWFLL
ncbi:hypothetical protein F4677DRAFT_461708 [Hypoxylon crocopeplum]|nr:hypothetical protein F4677DRAFT_461708 [Hypoxylon crocopeplum]